ncbi:multiple C2 and transmembrane domain-containing protein-like isoform X2 [Ostrinia furnacalis]|uniref:multiple C2 and transmembrane domain-containing protein-like isoform X2 n=1 Tax=Ostrinia furnacalis TaxID=93504 RepID=UPI00103E872D|nr:multiple C2 and transmembrane domain-containing protein-like isoform X2 [Ostrinia furnacalis]
MWSFPIPEGLVMDPLAPTALAVSNELMGRIGSGLSLLRDHGKKVQKYVMKNRRLDILTKKSWKYVVNVVLVEAKDLPDGPTNGSNGLYCKFKLGAETHKSKQVSKSKPMWCERFNLYLYEDNNLEITVWHKGKQKNFMGRCVINLSRLEREKTQDLWLDLECGYGCLHLLLTVSGSARGAVTDGIPTTNGIQPITLEKEEFSWYKLDNWNEVGQLLVTVHGARGLSALGLGGGADAYCVLELDNCRVQTHTVPATNEPNWNKTYFFGVNDITSTLDITVMDESIINSIKGETLGKLSIPLLRISNDEMRWYALKDRCKKSNAKGNCPRILLQMSVVWNPIKASVRVLSPKETKYMQKPPKFNIPLIYSNLKFIRDVFNAVYIANEHYKRAFEWENREMSVIALVGWLVFWFFFRIWMTPLLALGPFVYFWVGQKGNRNALILLNQSEDEQSDDELENHKDEKTIKTRLYGLQDLTFTIKNAIDYIVSLIERLKNLVNFTVPYLSYLAMAGMMIVAFALYFIPFNYLIMALGIYKFTRKVLNPDRVPNNDVLDFLSRVPDNEVLKQWRELKVPEPNLSRMNSIRKQTATDPEKDFD